MGLKDKSGVESGELNHMWAVGTFVVMERGTGFSIEADNGVSRKLGERAFGVGCGRNHGDSLERQRIEGIEGFDQVFSWKRGMRRHA